MRKQILPILFILCIISVIILSSCSYQNMPIPALEKDIIDTSKVETDTSGHIYGKFYINGSEDGVSFQAYTVDVYTNADTVLSISEAYKNQKFLILLSNNSVGTYTAVSPVTLNDSTIQKKCLVYFDEIVSSNKDILINLDTGSIVVESFNAPLNLLRGTMNLKNSVGGTKYEFRGSFAFKLRITSFPISTGS